MVIHVDARTGYDLTRPGVDCNRFIKLHHILKITKAGNRITTTSMFGGSGNRPIPVQVEKGVTLIIIAQTMLSRQ